MPLCRPLGNSPVFAELMDQLSPTIHESTVDLAVWGAHAVEVITPPRP